MKPTTTILPRLLTTLIFCALFLRFQAYSQPSAANQIITLQVAELNALSITTHLLTVPGEVKPQIRYRASDATRLIWTSNGENRKITVKKVTRGGVLMICVDDVSGDHQPQSTEKELMDGAPFDLVQDLSRSAGSCLIRFEAVSFDEENLREIQHIVYTISSS